MNLVEDRLRHLMAEATESAPSVPDRAMALQRRIQRHRRMRTTGVAALIAVVVAGAAAGLVGLQSARFDHNAVASSPSTTPTVKLDGTNHVTVVGPKNILLIRIDGRQDTADPLRSDSIMVLHLSTAHNRGYLLAIPTNTYVAIPAYDNGKQRYPGGRDRISAAFAIGARGLAGADARQHGSDLVARTVRDLAGITFDAAAVIDYAGFQQVILALGGVDMYVDEQTTSIDIGYDSHGTQAAPYRLGSDGTVGAKIPGVTPQVYTVGQHHFAPWQALDYTRQRDLLANNDGDYGQARHEQQLLQAVYRNILATGVTTDPTKLNTLLDTIGKAATIDTGGISMGDWFYAMRGLDASNLIGIQMNAGKRNTMTAPGLGPVETLSQTSTQLLQAVLNDTVDQFLTAHPEWVSRTG